MNTLLNIDKKEQLFGFLIERTAKKMKQAFAKELLTNEAGITVDQWVILNILNEDNGISQFEIAKKAYKDAPTVTRIIDLLESKSFIERKAAKNDRRRFEIHLRHEGKNVVKKILPLAKAFRRRCYEGLSDRELKSLEKTMNTIFENLNLS